MNWTLLICINLIRIIVFGTPSFLVKRTTTWVSWVNKM